MSEGSNRDSVHTTTFAPVALFVYNRPWHTRETVNALRANQGSDSTDLFIFSDGAAAEAAASKVAEVRAYARTITGFKSVQIIERSRNFGLAESIIDGVTKLCNEFGRVIVVEDDIVTSPFFLQYLNDGLRVYEADDRVISIHGYLPPLRGVAPTTFFISGADCWGWATWKRGWDLFEPDGVALLEKLARHPRRARFDYINRYPNTAMLIDYNRGRNNSWAIRWHASAFLRDKVTLHPGRTLVVNIGMDGSGTHCTVHEELNSAIAQLPLAVERMDAVDDAKMWGRLRRFFLGLYVRRAMQRLRPTLRRKVSGGA